MSNVRPFPVDPELTGVVVAYKNPKLIADEVLPRVPVGKESFKYRVYDIKDSFTIPNTLVGRKSAPTQVEFGHTTKDSSTQDHGLDEAVPNSDIENAPEGYNPIARAAASVIDLVLLKRESRTADLVFNASSYADKHKATLTGAAQFSNAESDPITYLLKAMDKCVMRPNKLVMGQSVWTVLRTHPKVVKATHGNSGDSGVAARQAFAELLELDDVIVGQGWYNTANKGKEVEMKRLWGNHISLFFQDGMADINGRVTFGFTAQFGDRIAGSIEDPDIGLNGGVRVRAGERVRELITAPDLGYFIENAVA